MSTGFVANSLRTHSNQIRQDGLIWAGLNFDSDSRPFKSSHLWLGLGLLSDLGLPFDALSMFLAAKQIQNAVRASRPVTVLLADAHAWANGVDQATVTRRSQDRVEDLRRVSTLLELPVRPLLASLLDDDSGFSESYASAKEVCELDGVERHAYTVRGVADVLYFARNGGIKIGWTRSADPADGRGRHHEYETDALAAKADRRVMAAYVRPGITLDSSRPVAVPYTETVGGRTRLMLTGPDCGNFIAKLSDQTVSPRRRKAVLEYIAIIVRAFEACVRPLDGDDPLTKAESLYKVWERS
jgi:hypothetical protein